MKHKREVIESLLKSLSHLEVSYKHPDVIFRNLSHFSRWMNSVRCIFDDTGMNEELNIWNNAIKGHEYLDNGSLFVVMQIAKATLIAILNKLESTEVFNTPYLNNEDVVNAYQMSKLYVVLHCYENSVRCFIEQILSREFGDNWWEEAKNTKTIPKIKRVKNYEKTNKWISPRGGSSPLYCIDWGDLVTIVRNHQNLFLPYIGDIKFIENRFEQLEGLRNIVAHNGVLPSDDDFQRVFISHRDWCRQIKCLYT